MDKKEVVVDLTVTIGGKEFTTDEARLIWEKLNEIFGTTEVRNPYFPVIPYEPHNPPTPYPWDPIITWCINSYVDTEE